VSLKKDLTAREFFGKKFKGIYIYYLPAFLVAFISRQIILKPDIFGLGRNIICGIFECLPIHMSGLMMKYGYNGPDWYISSMLIAMVLIFPFLKKFRSYIAPWGALLVAVGCYGFLHYNSKDMNPTSAWVGVTYLANVRALGALNLGIVISVIVEKIQEDRYQFLYTKVSATFFSILKIMILGTLFCIMQLYQKFNVDMNTELGAVFAIAILILLIFGELSWGSRLCKKIIPPKAGKTIATISTLLYFSHRAIIFQIQDTSITSKKIILLVYILGTLVSMAVTWGLSKLLTKLMGYLHTIRIEKKTE